MEVGKEGTPHFQGVFGMKSPIRMRTLVKDFPLWYFQPCRSWNDSVKYCSKEDTRKEGPWSFNVAVPVADYSYKLVNLRPWQAEVIELVSGEPDDRSIHWYYDPVGGKGKTSLAKHVVCNLKPAIYVQGKSADIKAAIAATAVKPRIVLFGIPRTQEDFVSYEAIESCKDGIFFSGKYDSGMVVYKPPHVLIFANFKPDLSKLSADRWVVHDMSEPFSAVSQVVGSN